MIASNAISRGFMMLSTILYVIAQVPPSKLVPDMPRTEPYAYATTWMLVGAFTVGIIMLGFKQAKRNNRLEED